MKKLSIFFIALLAISLHSQESESKSKSNAKSPTDIASKCENGWRSFVNETGLQKIDTPKYTVKKGEKGWDKPKGKERLENLNKDQYIEVCKHNASMGY